MNGQYKYVVSFPPTGSATACRTVPCSPTWPRGLPQRGEPGGQFEAGCSGSAVSRCRGYFIPVVAIPLTR
ncbi:hypothetical protein [Streptomyces olindensis]|uniref:hypothetical protein n=1 Tax=Streptomyces olindensis TaxID=358823 RepID=UPI003F4D251A